MNILLKLFLGLFISMSLFSCVDSDDLRSDIPYNQTYHATYDVNTKKIDISSIINTKSGTFIKLGKKTSLTCNDKRYEYVVGLYTWEFDGLQDLNFELKKEDGSKLRNTIKKTDFKTINFKDKVKSLSKGKEKTIYWTGDDLREGEVLRLQVAQSNTGGYTIFDVDAKNDKSIKIEKDLLNDFSKGEAKLKLIRLFTRDLDQEDQKAGGNATIDVVVAEKIEIE